MVAVYGKRRVGKTYLIDECFKNSISFRHTGLPPVSKEEKQSNFKRQLKNILLDLKELLNIVTKLKSNMNMKILV